MYVLHIASRYTVTVECEENHAVTMASKKRQWNAMEKTHAKVADWLSSSVRNKFY